MPFGQVECPNAATDLVRGKSDDSPIGVDSIDRDRLVLAVIGADDCMIARDTPPLVTPDIDAVDQKSDSIDNSDIG